METLLTMTENELKRIKVIEQVIQKRLTQKQAAEELKLSLRQIKRLSSRLRNQGAESLISQKRGRPGNHQYPISLRDYVVGLIAKHYRDFRPTFATEMLAERHNLHFSKETIRNWMIAAELWIPRDKRRERAYQPRYRRACYGELVQIDGSEHAWFEDRGPKCTLLVYIDDATSQLMEARFVATESTYAYFDATRSYLERHGKPIAFYSDKHSVFRTNKKGELGGDGVTQFGRAMHELNIDIICANTSQAKGRVERANRTLQDRLIKEMRLANISTLNDGNRFLECYIDKFNAHFSKAALDATNVHRPLLPSDGNPPEK